MPKNRSDLRHALPLQALGDDDLIYFAPNEKLSNHAHTRPREDWDLDFCFDINPDTGSFRGKLSVTYRSNK